VITLKIPRKPPTQEEMRNILLNNFKSIANIEELRPQLEIVNSEYMHWDEVRVDSRFSNVDLKLIWTFVEMNRKLNSRVITLDGVTLRYVQTPPIEKMLHDLDIRIGGKIQIKGQILEPALQKKYLVNSLMEEAIASSQLEGAVTSRIAAKRMLRENRKPKTQSEKMIVNNYLTMRYIKDNAEENEKLTPELIKEIHKQITKDTLEAKEYEGRFRTDNKVKVFARDDPMQIIYDPPDNKNIDRLIEKICNFVNIESEEYYLHPFVKAMVLHYMIGYVHPFNDGNGRTARALFYWYLITQHYDYLEYIAVSTAINNAKAKYARAYLYSETDNNDITYFVKFNLQALNIAVTSFEKYIKKTRDENNKIIETIRQNPKLNFRQAEILISLSKNERHLTIIEMQKRYSTTYQTARVDLLDLVEQGYLQKITRGKQFIFLLVKNKCMGTA
jgi:Fic family protein